MRSPRASHFLFFFLMLLPHLATAHPPGLSSMEVNVGADKTVVKVTFAIQDIEAFVPMDIDLDAEVTPQELTDAKPAIAEMVRQNLLIEMDEDRPEPNAPGRVDFDDQNNVHVELFFSARPRANLFIESTFLNLFPDGHQQFVSFREESHTTVAEKMLKKEDMKFTVNLAGSQGAESESNSAWSTFADFFKLGIEHILTGYDHLLFLFALLAVTHSFWSAFKIITFFTIAHSFTLALAGLNLIELPSSLVEPFIALTIVYVSIENMIRGENVTGRHWLTFGFGLIHGFGFAGVLKEMDISAGTSGILIPLFSFNLGIEFGQIAVTGLVLPLIWWMQKSSSHPHRILNACSAAVGLMGAYWFLERTVMQ